MLHKLRLGRVRRRRLVSGRASRIIQHSAGALVFDVILVVVTNSHQLHNDETAVMLVAFSSLLFKKSEATLGVGKSEPNRGTDGSNRFRSVRFRETLPGSNLNRFGSGSLRTERFGSSPLEPVRTGSLVDLSLL
jgi:hypothetical protein